LPFAFYDLETTGLDPAFNQPLQFAAILVDDNFVEQERVNLRCRLSSHILPSPYAMVVTGVTPEEVTDISLPPYFEFAQQIRSLIQKWAPATWVGYNTINFDEPCLRQMFYQTLQPDLYETQFNGNDRLDIMLAVQSAWVYQPSIFTWPENNKGEPILKLDQLAPANGFGNHDAHDALGDVEATIHIARIIRDKAPSLWADMLLNRSKHSVSERLQSFTPMELALRFGGPPRAYVGCFCGFSADNPNSAGFFDLKLADPADYVDADDDTLANAVSASPKIIRSISINNAPNLFYSKSNDLKFIEKAALIHDRPDFQKRVGRALAARYKDKELDEDRSVETKIYEGFYTNTDKALLRDFQTSDWQQRADIVEQLEDQRLKQLGRRLIAFNSPLELDSNTKSQALEYLRNKWLTSADDKPKWTSFSTAEKDLIEIEAKGLASVEVIEDWRAFYEDRMRALEMGELF
jgi:exodeoxyribonuclease-1